MKICFVWAEKFRNFNDIGINLSSEIKFEYDSINNILKYTEIESLPNAFFGEKIKEVTGIIGKNGSGKSNALELICKALKGGKTDLNTDFLLIVEDNKKFIVYHYFKIFNVPKITGNLKITFEEYLGKINPLKVIFFSNVFDERRNGFNSDIADISVNNLSMRKFFIPKNKKLTDFQKQIAFIRSPHFKKLEIGVPDKILISLKLWNTRFSTPQNRYFYGENYESINEIKSFFKSRLKEIKDHNKLIQAIKFGFFFDIYEKTFRDYGRKGNYRNELIDKFNSFISTLNFNVYTEGFADNLICFLDDNLRNVNEKDQFEFYFEEEYGSNNNQGKSLIIQQIDFLKSLKDFFSILDVEATNDSGRNRIVENFIIDYSNKKVVKIINDFVRLFESSSFIDVNWLGISSGHKAYLNLFSSIYDEVKKSRNQNLLVCIDEGDLYLHPKWQIEFFDRLISVLPNIYSGEIQLILTSHSPFLLSDLPKQNITILDEKFLNSSFDGVHLKSNTFGGNLYDLYSEPFFLGDKRTSDFAYSKIKSLIQKVEDKEYLASEKKDLEKLTNILGDEIIQYRIKKMLKND